MDIDDCILDYPSRYLEEKQYKDIIENLFCVGNLKNTRILSSYCRPLRIVKKLRDKFDISEECNEDELNEKLNNLKVGIVRRKVVNGIKQDNDYFIDIGFINSIINIECFQYCSVYVKTNAGIENIRPNRVYLLGI